MKMTEETLQKAVNNALLRQFAGPISELKIEGSTFTFQCGKAQHSGLIDVRRWPENRVFGFSGEFMREWRLADGPVLRYLVILDEEKPLWKWAVVKLYKPLAGVYEFTPRPTCIIDECGSVTLAFNLKEKKK